MPESFFTEAEVDYLEVEFQSAREHGLTRPSKSQQRSITMDMCKAVERQYELGLTTHIGRWFANRAAQEEGRPRATRKTPEQLADLEDSFQLHRAYPSVDERIRLVQLTGLTKSQVDSWFVSQRKRREAELEANGWYAPDVNAPWPLAVTATESCTSAAKKWRDAGLAPTKEEHSWDSFQYDQERRSRSAHLYQQYRS